METSVKDYVFCSLLLSIITCATFVATYWVTLPAISWLSLGNYAVVLQVICFLLFYGVLSGLTVRLFVKIKPFQEGYFTMSSNEFTNWKILIIVSNFGNMSLAPFNFVFLKPLYAALYGAKIGKNIALSETIQDPYMVEIGDNTIIGSRSYVYGNYLHDNKIFMGRVKIGNNVTIGMNCVVLPNTNIGDGVTLSIGSVVMPGTVIPAGETWKGNPARKWQ